MEFQYRKRYGPVATDGSPTSNTSRMLFQYRKRYYPVATMAIQRYIELAQAVSFNTASGITQLQLWFILRAINALDIHIRFNTASGITQLQPNLSNWCSVILSVCEFQYRKRYYPVATTSLLLPPLIVLLVSIPQAVLPSCNGAILNIVNWTMFGFNTASGITQLQPT